ncbi:unnamed protein product [Paramecium octaurelia]|uniref:Uncharacterized protein n=1 Tax=Paramecium octaurelia TaxID=43137 RepID=A0A8S1WM93_PAROT|nr:unnamed protein product [Paramecium octaurelia]
MNSNAEELYLSVSEEKDLYNYSEWVAILLQDYEPYRYQDKYDKLVNQYQKDVLFQQMIWIVLKLDKNKNTFDDLIAAAIPGAKTKGYEAPIERFPKQQLIVSKKILKLKRKLQNYNVQFDFEDEYPLPAFSKGLVFKFEPNTILELILQ